MRAQTNLMYSFCNHFSLSCKNNPSLKGHSASATPGFFLDGVDPANLLAGPTPFDNPLGVPIIAAFYNEMDKHRPLANLLEGPTPFDNPLGVPIIAAFYNEMDKHRPLALYRKRGEGPGGEASMIP